LTLLGKNKSFEEVRNGKFRWNPIFIGAIIKSCSARLNE
jgi:hypothetical protein